MPIITGIYTLANPFIGHGGLVLNGRATENLRGRQLADIIESINNLGCGVTAAIDGTKLVLSSDADISIAGHQDVLDTIGIEPT